MSEASEVERLGRPRFVEADLRRQPGSRARVRVKLEMGGREHEAEADAVGDEVMLLRVVAETALRALGRAIGRSDVFELIGVKRIHAFDETVVLTCVRTAASVDGPEEGRAAEGTEASQGPKSAGDAKPDPGDVERPEAGPDAGSQPRTETRRLLGCVPVAGRTLAEATALSLLNATNRVVEWLPAPPSGAEG